MDKELKHKREEQAPGWYDRERPKEIVDMGIPCPFSHVIECDAHYINEYRNKVEFTIGRRYEDNALCVGFNKGNLSKGITFVDYPDQIKSISAASIKAAKIVEKLVIDSGIEPYDRRTNVGYWRILLFRESKKTHQALISVVVSKDYPNDNEK